MEETFSSTKELDDKLSKEVDRLGQLREALNRSNQMTDNMISTLTTFEERLEKLENTIKPVCDETENLQRRHENIERTLTLLDNVLGFYHITDAVEEVIKEKPSNVGLDIYLDKMNDLQKAVEFFTKNNPGSKEMSNVMTLYEGGKQALEREFRTLLTRYSNPVPAVMILDVLAEDDELPSEDAGSLVDLSDPSHKDLCSIAQWLLSCGHTSDYTQHYHAIRANTLKRSLQGLKDHLKSGSKDSSNMTYSPAMASSNKFKQKDGSSKKAARRMEFVKKASESLMKHSMAQLEAAGLKRPGTSSADSKEEGVEVDIDFFITTVSALLKLMEAEAKLMEGIIKGNQEKKVFERVVLEALSSTMKEGEQICINVKRATTRHDFSAVLAVFPVVKHLHQVRPEFEQVLDGCSPGIRSLLPKLITALDSTGARSLEDFVDYVKNDPNKASNMPKDGTVHELTSNTIIFLEQMLDFAHTAGFMLLNQDSSARTSRQNSSLTKKKVADYITKVLSSLGLNLNNKAETYSDPTLRAIFMLNNYNYILKALKRTPLLELIKTSQRDIELHYEDLILEQKRLYSQSWSGVMHYIQDPDSAAPELNKLKDKDRQAIKDKFTGFNKEMEELRRTQKQYAIPDVELQESLTQDNLEFILPVYRSFIDRYRLVNFTKNPDKYMRYTVQDVKRFTQDFFDTSA